MTKVRWTIAVGLTMIGGFAIGVLTAPTPVRADGEVVMAAKEQVEPTLSERLSEASRPVELALDGAPERMIEVRPTVIKAQQLAVRSHREGLATTSKGCDKADEFGWRAVGTTEGGQVRGFCP